MAERPSKAADQKVRAEAEPQQIPARMMNEFVYCQRLFYYEFVEGVFIESVDTLRGAAIHQRVDSGNGALPKAKRKTGADKAKAEEKAAEGELVPKESAAQDAEPETIHSRSVQMGSDRLGLVAKMDLVESKAEKADLLTALEVCPVDYKAGAPKEGEEANELWDTDKMQLGLQALILRDNGYTCNDGVIYYRATKQRVWVLSSPRSNERGPVEAVEMRHFPQRWFISPRSNERGPVEAACSDPAPPPAPASPRSNERGPVEASALGGHSADTASSPRSNERGPVEAW